MTCAPSYRNQKRPSRLRLPSLRQSVEPTSGKVVIRTRSSICSTRLGIKLYGGYQKKTRGQSKEIQLLQKLRVSVMISARYQYTPKHQPNVQLRTLKKKALKVVM